MTVQTNFFSDAADVFPAIRSLIPHTDPMVLLDHLLAIDAESLCAQVTITTANRFYTDGAVPAWIGIEYMAQAIAAFAGYEALQAGQDVKLGFLLGTRRYESQCAGFACGSILQVHIQRVLQHQNGLGAFECRIVDADTSAELVKATVTVFQPEDAQEFLKPNEQS